MANGSFEYEKNATALTAETQITAGGSMAVFGAHWEGAVKDLVRIVADEVLYVKCLIRAFIFFKPVCLA